MTGNESDSQKNGNSNKDFSWIKVSKYKDDPAKSWQERYEDLKNHHIEETSFLIDTIFSLLENQKTEVKSPFELL